MILVKLTPAYTLSKIDILRGPWEIDAWCNLEAEAIFEIVSGIQNMDGDLGG